MTNESAITPPGKKIKADATKDFFLKMITRDISLRDCIFDLLDNSIDGARRKLANDADQLFLGYHVQIQFDSKGFCISDNCGGILLTTPLTTPFISAAGQIVPQM